MVSGSRADYGLLRLVCQEINISKDLSLQFVATGSHLSRPHGYTLDEVSDDGIEIEEFLALKESTNSSDGLISSFGQLSRDFGSLINRLRPDMILVLGDRFEIFSVTIAAFFKQIPIAHIHGGELTLGAFDDHIRHSITKLSNLHFVTNKTHFKRVVQLGEMPQRVFNVGSLGVEAAKKLELLSKADLEDCLRLKFMSQNILVTMHPETLSHEKSRAGLNALLDSIRSLSDTLVIFSMPNADPDHKYFFETIENFVSNSQNAILFKSLGQLRYLSCMRCVDVVVGNSSSGIIEAPTMKVRSINIGGRQNGRDRAQSVLDCKPEKEHILRALRECLSHKFASNDSRFNNPYDGGDTSKKIVQALKNEAIQSIAKPFHDIEYLSEFLIMNDDNGTMENTLIEKRV